jgi:RNA polymerase sigma factor (sigma-70 family)
LTAQFGESVFLSMRVHKLDESVETWFKREILPQEAALLRYLSRVWPKRDEILDLRQEVYARLFEFARSSRPQMPRAFLFATARNLMVDRVRWARAVSIESVGDIDGLNLLVDDLTPEHHAIARQELRRLAWAFDRLPPKCREVMWLRRVQEMSQKDVARHLRVRETTIEKHLARAMRLLAQFMPAGNDWEDEHVRAITVCSAPRRAGDAPVSRRRYSSTTLRTSAAFPIPVASTACRSNTLSSVVGRMV